MPLSGGSEDSITLVHLRVRVALATVSHGAWKEFFDEVRLEILG